MKYYKRSALFVVGLAGLTIIGLVATQGTNLSSVLYKNLGVIWLAASIPSAQESRYDAVDWFEQGRSKYPKDRRMLYALALSHQFQGNASQALSTLERYLKDVPEDMAGQSILGELMYDAGDVAAALQVWSVYSDETVLIQKATDELAQGNLPAARQLLDRALSGDITTYSTAYRLAEQYSLLVNRLQQIGDTSEVAAVCDQGSTAFRAAIEGEPLLGFVRINHGVFLRNCERDQEAIEQFLSVDYPMNNTTRAWANHEIAQTYHGLSQDGDAVVFFEQAVAMDPRNGLYRLSLGQAYARQGRTEEARGQFTEILSSADGQWKTFAEKELISLP